MKKFTKVLAVALAVLMLMMTSVPAFANYSLPHMPENEWVDCYLPDDDYSEFYFTTNDEGWYVLTSYAEEEGADPYIRVTDSDDNLVAYGNDSVFYEKNCEAWFYAEAGKSYYIELGNYGLTKDGIASVSFYLEAENENSHKYCWDNINDGCCDWCGWQYCDHDCHKGGFAGFFWAIANFFNMIFGINEVCECGAYHW